MRATGVRLDAERFRAVAQSHASDGVAADRPAERGVSLVLFGIGARDGQLQVALLTSAVPAAQQSSCSSGGVQPGVDLDARHQAEAIVLRLISSNSCCVMEPVSRSPFAFSIWDAGEPLAPTDLTY